MGEAKARGTYEQRRANPLGNGWMRLLNHGETAPIRWTTCGLCKRPVRIAGMGDHVRAKHMEPA